LGVSRRLFPLNLEQKMMLHRPVETAPLFENHGATFSGKAVPELILLSSPYRFVIAPLVEYILKVEREHPDRQIAVLVPELVVKTLAAYFAPPPAARLLKLLLLVRGNQCVMVINIPWYL
jgi:hypothetical protein